jgi:hypothetical protein
MKKNSFSVPVVLSVAMAVFALISATAKADSSETPVQDNLFTNSEGHYQIQVISPFDATTDGSSTKIFVPVDETGTNLFYKRLVVDTEPLSKEEGHSRLKGKKVVINGRVFYETIEQGHFKFSHYTRVSFRTLGDRKVYRVVFEFDTIKRGLIPQVPSSAVDYNINKETSSMLKMLRSLRILG